MKKATNTPSRSQFAVLRQICNLIPSHVVPKLARETGVEKKARTFSPWSHLVSLIYAHLAHAIGLNDVCDSLRLHSGLLVTLRAATPPSRNNLSHANKERDANLAEKVFWAVLGHLQTLQPAFARGNRGRGVARRFRRAIHVVDSTTIQLADFLGHSANAVRWQVWTALLVYVLLRFLAFVSRWHHSFTRLFTLVRTALWQRWDLASLLDSYGTAPGDFRFIATPQQPCFNGF